MYTFDVESVIRGDPLDGRVYSDSDDCSPFFEVGATYLVHAQVADPGGDDPGNALGAPLVAGTCMAGEYLEPPPPLTAIGAWALSLLLTSAAGCLWYRRWTSTDVRPSRSD